MTRSAMQPNRYQLAAPRFDSQNGRIIGKRWHQMTGGGQSLRHQHHWWRGWFDLRQQVRKMIVVTIFGGGSTSKHFNWCDQCLHQIQFVQNAVVASRTSGRCCARRRLPSECQPLLRWSGQSRRCRCCAKLRGSEMTLRVDLRRSNLLAFVVVWRMTMLLLRLLVCIDVAMLMMIVVAHRIPSILVHRFRIR